MGMVAEEQQSSKGLVEHLQDAFQSGEMLSESISDFLAGLRRTRRLKMLLPMICRCWLEKVLCGNHLFI